MSARPPIPLNEAARQLKVDHYSCLGETEADTVLDQIVAMAAHYFKAPIALISIVDRNRQWFKSKVGVDVSETPRDVSFCAHALQSNALFEVCDAQQDPRFEDNILVTGSPFIRYYAGSPLIAEDGLILGSLCIIDTVPRAPMSDHDHWMIQSLASMAFKRLKSLREAEFIDASTGLFNRQRLQYDAMERLNSGDRLLMVAVEPLATSTADDLVKALGFSFANEFGLKAKALMQELLPASVRLYKLSPFRYAFFVVDHGNSVAEKLFERLLAAFSVPLICSGVPVLPQLALGVLPMGREEIDQDWIRHVVIAANEAREAGGGWSFYDSAIDAQQQRATLLLNDLPAAVQASEQLHLVYQPKVDLITGQCVSVEALLRWTHPTLGNISPVEFIPLAEQTAYVRKLTSWVLRRAVSQAAQWRRSGMTLKISVNISATDLVDESLSTEVTGLLDEFKVPGDCLEVEFTESMVVKDFGSARKQLERLKALGVGIAIDDFGSGYSNWSYLREIPANSLKLDRSFMGNLSPGQIDWSVVRGLISIARELNLRIVAEGVETDLTYQLMRGWGCHEAQGYFIAKPMTVDALADWLKAYRAGRSSSAAPQRSASASVLGPVIPGFKRAT
ncbi:sensor domain-containing phosphodiesterase [Pseudomonas matsuisoli]|uniref:Sensor domain-containing phosphodiesterase n=1 Tax=Pseudomonas matsuisoli TaxID=1515666 RepID=A0A917Q315_9PSED|nr:GGDEF and EAL domain-containing protein [Pseudomonas matsuisoli]GGK08741.1 sensor domain-containing phosphodiesterase [Pseudomonas matsuisoli]